MKLATLDRYVLFELAALRWAMLLFIGTFLLMLGDFVGQMGYNVQLVKERHFDLLLRYYILRFPEFLLVWLPLSVPGAAILTAIPMMSQRTIIALSASGIPPRRVFASLLPLALLCGLIGFELRDQVVPRLQGEVEYLQAIMDGKIVDGGLRARPGGWRSGSTHWSAQVALPALGEYRTVSAFRYAGSYDNDVILLAHRLIWREGAWWLEDVVWTQGGRRKEHFAACTPEKLGLELNFPPRALALALRSDDAKTVDEVHQSKGSRYKQVLSLRVAAAFLPLMCLLFALPFFIRQQNGRIGTATVTALGLAFVPVATLGLLAKVMVSTSVHPVYLTAGTLAFMLFIGAWFWWRMRL